MKPIIVSSGEPAGIGPDICLALADSGVPLVIAGSLELLRQRATLLGAKHSFRLYEAGQPPAEPNTLTVLDIPTSVLVTPGQPDPNNSQYVLTILNRSIKGCLNGEFSALVTAPINKAVINQSGIPFSGHTEYLANACGVEQVVMMLSCELMRIALITTHLPLSQVPSTISTQLVIQVIQKINQRLISDFAIQSPKIFVAGLNPHAGEDGYLGREEIDIIIPALNQLKSEGIDVVGPFPADTMFTRKNCTIADVFVAMYHDQGLPVLKFAGFGNSVNITLGLPFIRTSVDHGTATEIAATGKANAGSLNAAVAQAVHLVKIKESQNDNHQSNSCNR